MSLISFSNVFRSYGTQVVLEGASFTINRGEHVGLVGRNGAGKSTIVRLITGVERPERGAVILQPRLRIGQVEQEPNLDGSISVAESVLLGRPELVEMETELRRLEESLGHEGADHDAILDRYGALQHEFDRLGGHEFHGKAAAVLSGLGLPPEMHDREVGVLSGGQKTRLALARLLLSDPDVLLLDEPTNHLDLEATEWLQSYLQRSSATLLLVSHDRYLLDAVCDHVIEVEHLRTTSYKGNYSAFLRQKAERLEREKDLFDRQQQEIQKLEAYIRRYKAGNRATMAKSRERMLARLEPMDRPMDSKGVRVNLGQATRSGRDVVRAVGVSKSFGDVKLFENLNLVLERGERLGVVGPNGAGKTTFIRMLMGQQAPTAGELSVGTNVQGGYFSQDLKTSGGNRSIIEEITAESDLDIPAARSMLARFLFTDEDVFKSIDDLSGGERNRVALCKLLLSRPNFLILDEPTNHLDIATREGLIDSLVEFKGTMLVASHDRYLLDRVATEILEIADGSARLYRGNYSEYRRERFGEPAPLAQASGAGASALSKGSGRPADRHSVPGQGSKRQPAHAPRAVGGRPATGAGPKPSPSGSSTNGSSSRISSSPGAASPASASGGGKKTSALPRLEKQIQELEKRLAALTERMNDPDLYKSPDMHDVVSEYDRVGSRLASLYDEWTALAG